MGVPKVIQFATIMLLLWHFGIGLRENTPAHPPRRDRSSRMSREPHVLTVGGTSLADFLLSYAAWRGLGASRVLPERSCETFEKQCGSRDG